MGGTQRGAVEAQGVVVRTSAWRPICRTPSALRSRNAAQERTDGRYAGPAGRSKRQTRRCRSRRPSKVTRTCRRPPRLAGPPAFTNRSRPAGRHVCGRPAERVIRRACEIGDVGARRASQHRLRVGRPAAGASTSADACSECSRTAPRLRPNSRQATEPRGVTAAPARPPLPAHRRRGVRQLAADYAPAGRRVDHPGDLDHQRSPTRTARESR